MESVSDEPELSRQELATLQGIEDQRAIDATLAGDTDAFGELTARYHRVLVFGMHRITGDFDLAEDVVQSAYTDAYIRLLNGRRPPEFYDGQKGRPATAWLFRLARNRYIDYVRSTHRELLSGPRGGGQVVVPDVQELTSEDLGSETYLQPEEAVMERQRQLDAIRAMSIVRYAVSQLPVAQREAIELRYFHGLKRREMMEHLPGITASAVTARLNAGYVSLRAVIDHELLEAMCYVE